MAGVINDYTRPAQYSYPPVSSATTAGTSAPQYSQYPTYQYPSDPNYTYAPTSTCPPGCTCGYSTSYAQAMYTSQQQQQQYPVSPGQQQSGGDWQNNQAGTPPWNEESQSPPSSPVPRPRDMVNTQPPEQESGKYPFSLIMSAIVRGIVGTQGPSTINVTPEMFRTKLDTEDSQKLSSLLFFKTFTQRDVNLQCTLIMQVLKYWSLEETMPDFSAAEGDNGGEPKRSRSGRRESGHSSKRKQRNPPPPRYWSRLENAAVIGVMMGLPFTLLKMVLEAPAAQNLHLGEVDAILDTNSVEAIELFKSGLFSGRNTYDRGRYRIPEAQTRSEQYTQSPPQDYSNIRLGYNT